MPKSDDTSSFGAGGRQAVVTGMGAVCSLGVTAESSWRALIAGKNGASIVDRFDVDDLRCRIACMTSEDDVAAAAADWLEDKEKRRLGGYLVFAAIAAGEALKQAGWFDDRSGFADHVGCIIGSGAGDVADIERNAIRVGAGKARAVSPFFVPYGTVAGCSTYLSTRFALTGPCHSISSACSSGAHAISSAAQIIACGEADAMLVGGAESSISRLSLAAFDACRALTADYNDRPQAASRPFDRDRSGFVMGEGAAMLTLESREHAERRGADILARLIGHGQSADGYHSTAPDPEGRGALRAMKTALDKAERNGEIKGVDDIDYINAHAASTPLGDEVELSVLNALFGAADDPRSVAVSSTKSAVGHLLGAAGAVEAVFSIMAIRDGCVPPTLNLERPCIDTPLRLVGAEALAKPVSVAMSNAFGFGGVNSSLIFCAPHR